MLSLQWKMNTDVGALHVVASAKGLQGLYWQKQSIEMLPHLRGRDEITAMILTVKKEIENYLSGESQKFKVKLDLVGSEFQKKVWNALLKIPFGETRSYKQIAEAIRADKAWRAVGTANGQNPICIIIPCHRVIASNGTLGGYTGGINNKRKLLNLEKSPKQSTL